MSMADCPSHDRLFDYVVGRLSDVASEVLASHLDTCSTCQTKLATLDDASDSLVARLRAPVPDDPLLAEPECGIALARAKAVAGSSAGPGARRPSAEKAPFRSPASLANTDSSRNSATAAWARSTRPCTPSWTAWLP